jgi:glycerophosphoryl diester phosphodiesterase
MGLSALISGSVELSRPLVIAHRGASLAYPENTLPAFEAAIAAGADLVELDVRMTGDGVAVVSHDGWLGPPGEGPLIHRMTLAEIRRLEEPPGSIPLLEDVLELAAGRAGIDLEVKNLPDEPSFDSPDEAVASEVIRLLARLAEPVRRSMLVSSFNWLSIERVRALAPDVATGFLTWPSIDPRAATAYAAERGHTFVLPQVYGLLEAGPEAVRAAHEAGLRIGTWVVDGAGDIERMLSWGVDAVITNDPVTGVRVRDGFVGRRA